MNNATAKKNTDVSARTAEEAPPAEAQTAAQDEQRGPIEWFREENVSASIWARERNVRGKTRTFYDVTFQRSYEDSAGKRRYTTTFNADDLGKVVALAQKASAYIRGLEDPAPAA